MIDENILKFEEQVVFAMRKLFVNGGYRQFKMSKFEEYDLYSKNKDFLVNDGVITFNDTNGKLLALKPDVTLSIIKNSKDLSSLQKYYYNENVYRISESTHAYKEIMQTGLECIGPISDVEVVEVVSLAIECLKVVSNSTILALSNVGLLNAILDDYKVAEEKRADIIKAINEKNVGELKLIVSDEQFSAIKCFPILRVKLPAEIKTSFCGRSYRILPQCRAKSLWIAQSPLKRSLRFVQTEHTILRMLPLFPKK